MILDEQYILKQIRNRDIGAFEILFNNFKKPLTLFAQQFVFDLHAGEDIVQEIFIHFWENAHRIEIRTSLKSYFYQSTKNRCYNHLRNKNIYDKHNLLYIESLLASNDNDIFNNEEINESLEKAIEKLPSEMKRIMTLKYLEKKKITEVSNILNISNNTTKTQLMRGKQKLKELIVEMTTFNIF
jgi:RNA polymerase sigma-70 factor (ECF subfamily)